MTDTTRHIVLGRERLPCFVERIELKHLAARRDDRAQAFGEHLLVPIVAENAQGDHRTLSGRGERGTTPKLSGQRSKPAPAPETAKLPDSTAMRIDYESRERISEDALCSI